MPEPNNFPPTPPGPPVPRWWGDRIFQGLTAAAALALIALLALLLVILIQGSSLSFHRFGIGFLPGQVWDATPGQEVYGLEPFIIGTLVTSTIALLFAVPVALGSSIFLTQLAPQILPWWLRWTQTVLAQCIELLAAIPSIIYGFWALLVLVPIMREHVEPTLFQYAGWTHLFGGAEYGLDIFTASVVLSIMIIPTIAAVSRDSLAAVPVHQREAALSLGATDWEAARVAVVPYARTGIFGGTILGLGRAFGETMAVTLLIGNSPALPTSLFSQGQTIASLIATSYGENSGPLEYSALIEAGLVLLVITLLVNIGARTILWRFQRNAGTGRE